MYNQITPTGRGLIFFAKNSLSNIEKMFIQDVQASGQSPLTVIFNPLRKNTVFPTINTYIDDLKTIPDYSAETINKYPTFNKNPVKIIDTKIPFYKQIYLTANLFQIIPRYIIIIGLVFLLWKNKKYPLRLEIKIILILSFLLLGVVMVMPFISLMYDLGRLYQQFLFLLSPLFIIGMASIFNLFKIKRLNMLFAIILSLLLLSSSGLLFFYIEARTNDSIKFSNNLNYGNIEFLVHKTDASSSIWLFANQEQNPIYTDSSSKKAVTLYRSLNYRSSLKGGMVLESLFNRDSYVYSGYYNKNYGISTKLYKMGQTFYFNFPTEFLNENKNKIYNNGGSEIFK